MSATASPGLRRAVFLSLAFVAVVAALLTFSTSAYAAEIVVNDDGSACAFGAAAHTTIQAAVNAASNGDVIRVCNGTYADSPDVNKTVMLFAESQAAILSKAIGVQANGVIIDGFTINHFTVYGSGGGVVVKANDVVIRNNNFVGPGIGFSDARGIHLQAGSYRRLQVIDNTFDAWLTGIYLNPGSDHFILGNTFGTSAGFTGGVALDTQTDTMVIGNVFAGPFADEAIGANDVGTNVVVRGNRFDTAPAIKGYGALTSNLIDARLNFFASGAPNQTGYYDVSSPLGSAPTERIVNDDGVATPCVIGTVGYATIGAAVLAADTGDTIRICDGNYYEGIMVHAGNADSLSIVGQSRGGVKIFGTGGAPSSVYAIDVQYGPVVLRSFSLWSSHDLAGFGLKVSGQLTPFDADVRDISVFNSQRTAFDFNKLSKVTLKNVWAENTKWGNGVALTTVGSMLLENVTTRDNNWGGIAIYGVNSPVIQTTAARFVAPIDNNEPINVYVELTTANPGVFDVAFGGFFRYMVQNSGSTSNYYAFAPAGEESVTASTLALKFGGSSEITDLGISPSARVDFVTPTTAALAATISGAAAGDTLVLGSGNYVQNLDLTKHIRLIGDGNGANPALDTIIKYDSSLLSRISINIAGSGASAADPLLIKGLRIIPDDSLGISFNGENEGSAANSASAAFPIRQYIKLDRVIISGSAEAATAGENEFCMYQGVLSAVDNMVVTNSAFNNCDHGWYTHVATGPLANACNKAPLTNVTVSNTEFRNNGAKGGYFEKLSDATFTNVLFANNGLRPNQSGNPDHTSGLDINLKWGLYQNITLNNLSVVSNGLGVKEGAGFSVKARGGANDPSYDSNPCSATLNLVTINGGVFAGNERGIRIGEIGSPSKSETSPALTVISGAGIYKNLPQFSGGASDAGDLIATAADPVTADGNWWGQAGGPVAGQVKNPGGASIATASPLASYVPVATITIADSTRRFWTPNGSPWNPPSSQFPATLFMSVPLEVSPWANQISSLTAKIDYDQACLDFLSATGPGGWVTTPTDDSVNGIVDLYVGDQATPLRVLSGGAFATLTFAVDPICIDQISPLLVTVVNGVCGDVTGSDVPCSGYPGNYTLDFNTPLTAFALSNSTVNENLPAPATIGSLSVSNGADTEPVIFAVEPDSTAATRCGSGSYNHSLITINGTTLQTARVFDYEATPGPFDVCLKATDQRGSVIWLKSSFSINDLVETKALVSVSNSLAFDNVVREGSATPLEFPLQFNSNGNTVTTLSFVLTYATTCLDFDGVSMIVPGGSFVESPAGTITFTFSNPPAGPGNLALLKFRGISCPGLRNDVALDLNTPTASNGVLPVPAESPALDTTAIVIENSARGDCNANGFVNAGDLSATVLEFWDVADQSHTANKWLESPYSFFPGSPYGCDANGSLVNEIADVTCTVLGIFGGNCLTNAPLQAASAMPAMLVAPATAEGNVVVRFQSQGHRVGAVGFTLTFGPEVIFDPTDGDGDGLADAITVNLPPSAFKMAAYDGASRSLKVVVLTGIMAQIPALADGTLMTVSVQGAGSLAMSELSAGATDGYDVPVVFEAEQPELSFMRIYLPSVLR